MTARLMLHCGAHHVAREEVARVVTPERTRTWVPVRHNTLIDTVQAALEGVGLSVAAEAHALARDGNRYFGLLQVTDHDPAGEFGLVVGLRNSHDQSFPAGLVVGASVFVCDNLSFSGEVRLARKHTAHVERDLPQLVSRAVGRLGELRRGQEERFAAYRQAELADGAAHDLVIRAIDARVLPVTRVPLVLKEWRTPRHPEFTSVGKTAWRLFNAFTESLKGNLDQLPRRTQALHGLLDITCGLAVSRN